MTTISAPSRRLAAGCLAAAFIASLAAATPAAGASHPTSGGACSFDQASLPKTPDAVEGWYASCRARPDVATTSGLPQTPDAIEAWSR